MALSPTRQTIYLRETPAPAHPPYGLFDDPHRGLHAWWAIDSRTVIGLATLLGALGAILSLVST